MSSHVLDQFLKLTHFNSPDYMSGLTLEEGLHGVILLEFTARRLGQIPCTLHCSLFFRFPQNDGNGKPRSALLIEVCETRDALMLTLLGCRQHDYNKEKLYMVLSPNSSTC